MRMMPTPRMRRHFLLSTTTTTMLIVVLLVMNTGRNVNGDEAAADDPRPQQQPNKPEVQTGPCGLGEHTLNEDGTAVTLADGSIETTEVDKYQKSGRGKFKGQGCKVSKEGEFFIVHYDQKAATDGCAVDFITNAEMATFEFKASVADKQGLAAVGSCLADCVDVGTPVVATNDNIVPFVFSQSNAKVEKLHEGPIYSKDDNICTKTNCDDRSAEKKCISFTALEIRWSKCGLINGYLHQVGEPEIKTTTVIVNGNDKATMDIKGTDQGFDTANPVCISAINEGIPVPKAWKIVGNNLKDSYLFVFHLLPQTATRKYDQKGKMTDDVPAIGMPKCMKDDGLSFKFSTSLYTGLLTTMELPTTPSTTTTTTTAKPSPPSESDQTEKTVETTGATSPSGGPTTTTAACPTSTCQCQPPANGSSTATPSAAGLPIMEDLRLIASTAVLLGIIIVLIIVIICLYIKYKKAAKPVVIEDGTGAKKDANIEGRQTILKTMVQPGDEFGKEDYDDGRSRKGILKNSQKQQPMDKDEGNRRTKKKKEMQSVKEASRPKNNDDDDYADDDEEDKHSGGRGSPNKGSGKDNEEEFTMEPDQQDEMAYNEAEPKTTNEEPPSDVQSDNYANYVFDKKARAQTALAGEKRK